MSKNKINFIIGQVGSGIIFFIGVLYILMPNIYGLDQMSDIAVNDLFLSMMLILSCVNLGFYYLVKKNPTNEAIYLSMVASICGVLNIICTNFLTSSLALAISVLAFTVFSSIVRLCTIDYYHDKKDAYLYIEVLLTGLFFISGIIISISLFNDPLIQTIELGFLLIIVGVIESMKVATKCLLKAPRFLGKIKF